VKLNNPKNLNWEQDQTWIVYCVSETKTQTTAYPVKHCFLSVQVVTQTKTQALNQNIYIPFSAQE
jgi:hypothetical protein